MKGATSQKMRTNDRITTIVTAITFCSTYIATASFLIWTFTAITFGSTDKYLSNWLFIDWQRTNPVDLKLLNPHKTVDNAIVEFPPKSS